MQPADATRSNRAALPTPHRAYQDHARYDAGGKLLAEYNSQNCPESGTRFRIADHLGSTRLLFDTSGNVQQRFDFLPFGEELLTSTRTSALKYGAASIVKQRFTGRMRDAETHLDYFNARYLSPNQGRFMSIDPGNAGASTPDPQSWNAYSYTINNPLLCVDSTGLAYQICDAQGHNCALVTDMEWEDCERGGGIIRVGNRVYQRIGSGRQGNLLGTASWLGSDLDSGTALALRVAGDTADREIKIFVTDVAISVATGFVVGGVFQGAAATARFLPFKDARLLQRISNILDEIASGRRNFEKAREFMNDGRAGSQSLPSQAPGYYREFTTQPAAGAGRGSERLVVGRGGEVYYTPNHYGSFVRIQ